MRYLFTLVALYLISLPVHSDSFEIQFSGVFRACEGTTPCDGTLLGNLVDTPFSGRVIFPTSATPIVSDDGAFGNSDRSIYVFDSEQAQFSITTNESQLNLQNYTPVVITVNDCIDATCQARDDYVWFEVSTTNFSYALQFNSSSGQFLNGSAIPDLSTLSNMSTTAGLSIFRSDFSRELNTFDATGFNILAISIRTRPDLSSEESCFVIRAANGNVVTFCL